MLDVKEAAQRASEYLAGLYADQSVSISITFEQLLGDVNPPR